jgi:hypothetical protein
MEGAQLKIYLAGFCHNFQQRYAWQLSSILEQEPFDAELRLNVACMVKNGIPSTEYLCYFFKGRGLDIGYSYYNRDVFAKRGLVRNWQIKEAEIWGADWIFFNDVDNVYSKDFFKLLVEGLRGPLANVTNCIYSKAKAHTVTEQTDEYARLALQCPYIPHTYLRAHAIPRTNKGNKPVSAGCQQVCSMEAIRAKTGGVYVPEKSCRDSHLFDKGQKAKSDKQFRKAMGGSTHYPLPLQIHMGHDRDKELGFHSEAQR